MCTENNPRDSCHSNFSDPRDPISSILDTWTNFFSRKKRFLHQKRDAIKQLKKLQVSQLLQTVSAENRFFKRAFEKTIFSRDRVQKRRCWKHVGHFPSVFTMLFETTIKPQRECEKHVFGRKMQSFNREFKAFSTNAREKYYKTRYFGRR